VFTNLGAYFLCIQQAGGAWTRQLTTLSRLLVVGNIDVNQPFVSSSPDSAILNEDVQFTLFGTPLAGSKAAFVLGTNCGATRLYVWANG
jgi:hypothetical protein